MRHALAVLALLCPALALAQIYDPGTVAKIQEEINMLNAGY